MSAIVRILLTQSSRLLLYFAIAVLLIRSYQARNFELEDALIYFRYFQNFIEGKGLVYNEGVYFNGLTSPLYSYLMILIGGLTRHIKTNAWIVSTLSLAAAGVVLYLYSSSRQDKLGTSLGLLVGFSLPYFYATYGMETSLFLLLLSLDLLFYKKGDFAKVGVISALLIMTRAEGVFLILAFAIDTLIKRKNTPAWKDFIIPSLILAAHYSFNKTYYGKFLPSTGSAKIWQGKSGLWGEQFPLFYDPNVIKIFCFANKPWIGYLVAIFAAIGIITQLKKERSILIFILFYISFFCLLNIPNYFWYNAPIMLFLFYFAGNGLLHTGMWLASWTEKKASTL